MYMRSKVCTFSRLWMLQSTKLKVQSTESAAQESFLLRSGGPCFLPGHDLVRRCLSQHRTLCKNRPRFLSKVTGPSQVGTLRGILGTSFRLRRAGLACLGKALPSRDVARHPRRIVPAWENSGFVGAKTGPYLHKIPPWERIALLSREGPRRSSR